MGRTITDIARTLILSASILILGWITYKKKTFEPAFTPPPGTVQVVEVKVDISSIGGIPIHLIENNSGSMIIGTGPKNATDSSTHPVTLYMTSLYPFTVEFAPETLDVQLQSGSKVSVQKDP